ncbi:polysaccharide biosynthesis tyrosine autokinase [Methyloprofundus sedimenti]|nr:polysaccharide biosynthesis tyrosine autokinase [Methyloprofundus sedimenti]
MEHTTGNYPLQDEDEIDLRELIGTLLENKWLIILITIIAFVIGIVKVTLETPIYQADAMLQVESSQSMMIDPFAEGMGIGGNTPVQAEMEIIKSRMIMGATVTSLNLEIVAEAKYFPVIGAAMARRFEAGNKDMLAAPWLGFSDYAWGGEIIQVDTLDMPASWIDIPITLIAGKNGQFKLFDMDEQFVTDGEVGKPVSITVDGGDTALRIFVSILKARPGTHFIVLKQSQVSAMEDLIESFSVAEKGRDIGILSFTMLSASPSRAMQTLNEVANIYVRMNVEKKSAEAQKTLEFLEKQLPTIKSQLEVATDELNEYRLKKGSVNLGIETQSILGGIVEKNTQVTLLEQKKDELRQSFTSLHPAIISIDRQINRLQKQIIQHNKKVTQLPETQQVILELSRDVQVNAELYSTMLNNLQAIKVAKSGTVGDVRVIDYAVMPTLPIKPKKSLIVAVATILGLIMAIALVFIRKAMHHGIEDPDIIEKQLNVPVYATILHSEKQLQLNKQLNKNKTYIGPPVVLVLESEDDMAIESLRSLRTTLHFAFLEAKNNIIMITGPSPGVGKSFVSTNLAIVLARAGKKVLLIDADLRRGLINKALGVSRENGLSELISNVIKPSEAIHTIDSANIDFIPTGAIPPNPSELLLHEHFGILLEDLGKKYDHIIIDSPPILAVTDACIIGRMASATLMVIRSGQHPLRELQQSVKRLKQNDVNIKGCVFNDVHLVASGYGYGKYFYQYDYQK